MLIAENVSLEYKEISLRNVNLKLYHYATCYNKLGKRHHIIMFAVEAKR